MTSKLENEDWAVISERGREAANLSYEEARRLVHRLGGEGRRGLCIVTSETAQRLTGAAIPAGAPALQNREQ